MEEPHKFLTVFHSISLTVKRFWFSNSSPDFDDIFKIDHTSHLVKLGSILDTASILASLPGWGLDLCDFTYLIDSRSRSQRRRSRKERKRRNALVRMMGKVKIGDYRSDGMELRENMLVGLRYDGGQNPTLIGRSYIDADGEITGGSWTLNHCFHSPPAGSSIPGYALPASPCSNEHFIIQIDHASLDHSVAEELGKCWWLRRFGQKTTRALMRKSEALGNELIMALLGVSGQYAMQMPSSSSSAVSAAKMAANGAGFIFLLSGALLRRKRKGVGSLLLLLGIVFAAAGIILGMAANIPGKSGYIDAAACLIPVLAALF